MNLLCICMQENEVNDYHEHFLIIMIACKYNCGDSGNISYVFLISTNIDQETCSAGNPVVFWHHASAACVFRISLHDTVLGIIIMSIFLCHYNHL